MRITFASPVIGILLISISSWVAADVQICDIDAFYKGLWHNSEIDYDATTYCRSLLSFPTIISCVGTTTSRVTEMPSANTTTTITSVSNVPTSTITLTSTAIVFDVATTSIAASARARYGRRLVADVSKRQAIPTSHSSLDLTASLVSACTCNPSLGPETQPVICTVNSTITNSVITRTTLTEFLTVSSGTTTVTATVYTTTNIPIASNSTSTSLQTSWTVSISFSTVANASTTTTTTPTIQPSGCPSINGTRLSSSSQDCTYYERFCSRSYSDDDFYNAAYRFDTPEQCAALCDAQNRGAVTACLGIVWDTGATSGANCRQLKTLDSPKNDTGSIAILLSNDQNCPINSSSTMTSMTSTSTMYNSTSSVIPMSTTTNTNSSRTVDASLTSSAANTTANMTMTTSGMTNSTWMYATINTSNNTVCSPSTIYATIFSTITPPGQGWNNSWKSWPKKTSGSVVWVGATNTTSTVTVTSTLTSNYNTTITQTETITSNLTSTKTETQTITLTVSSNITATVSNCSSLSSSSSSSSPISSLNPVTTTTSPTTTTSEQSSTTSSTSAPLSTTITTTNGGSSHRVHWWGHP